jgi:hypothetical protein
LGELRLRRTSPESIDANMMIAGKFSAFMNAQSQLEPMPQTPIESSFRKANKAVETSLFWPEL